MKMAPVKSSNIAAIGYENGVMHVQFVGGGTYVLSNVTPKEHADFMASPSKGSHYHAHFRGSERHGAKRHGG